MFADPFAHAMALIRNTNIPTANFLNNLIESDLNDINQFRNDWSQAVLTNQSSKCVYPNLIVHGINSGKHPTVN